MPRKASVLDVVPPESVLTHRFNKRSGELAQRMVTARVNADGSIQLLDGLGGTSLASLTSRVFEGPSPAAEALRGNRPTSGWEFWKYDGMKLSDLRDSRGNQGPLATPGDVDAERLSPSQSEIEGVVKRQLAQFIESVAATYERERSRYQELLDQVMATVPAVVGELPVAVQQRVKEPAKLHDKLKDRWGTRAQSDFVRILESVENAVREGCRAGLLGSDPADADAPDSLSVLPTTGRKTPQQQVLDDVPDLAGIRIIVYRKSDMEKVLQGALRAWGRVTLSESGWTGADSEDPASIYLAKHKKASDFEKETGGAYVADHLRLIFLAKPSEDGKQDPLRHLNEARCEIQITTMTQHLLNEVGHDVLYKRNSVASPQAEPQDKNMQGMLSTLKDFMVPLDKNLEKLYATLPAREAKRAGSRSGNPATDSPPSQLADELFPEPKPFTSEDRFHRWVVALVLFGSEDPNPSATTREAMSVLQSKSTVKRELKRRGIDIKRVADEYQAVYQRDDFVISNTKSLSADDGHQTWVLKVLAASPPAYLEDFVTKRGSHTSSPGRPPLIVNIAKAFLASQIMPDQGTRDA